ncbi:MAG: hypothetical protein LAT76_10075 [Schleiferiaceae bacterium]|nr:hypothetical protein [Schleiferiaceae bacterium]
MRILILNLSIISWLLIGILTSGCQHRENPEITTAVLELKQQVDSIGATLDAVDMKAVEDWRRFIDHRYRFFYKNYESLDANENMMSLLNDLEASKKMIGKMADQGDGLFKDFNYCKMQVESLASDYTNGLLADSTAQKFIASEQAALHALSNKVKKRAAPIPYYVAVMDSIAPLLDSAMTHYELKLN